MSLTGFRKICITCITSTSFPGSWERGWYHLPRVTCFPRPSHPPSVNNRIPLYPPLKYPCCSHMQTCALLRHLVNTANGAPSEDGSRQREKRFRLSKQRPPFAWEANYLWKNNIIRYKCPAVIESDTFDDFSQTCHDFCFGWQVENNRPWGTNYKYRGSIFFRDLLKLWYSYLKTKLYVFFNDVCLGFTLGTFKLACAVFEAWRWARKLFAFVVVIRWWIFNDFRRSWLDNTQKTTLN